MRMVFHLTEDRVTGRNIIPGGQAANTEDPHFADQAALWLGNQTLPVRTTSMSFSMASSHPSVSSHVKGCFASTGHLTWPRQGDDVYV